MQDVAASRPETIASALLAQYVDDRSDLITAMPINETKFAVKVKVQGSAGLHAAVQTPSFTAAFRDPTRMRTASVFVQRWSAALAAALEEATLRRSMHGWAEIATPSLCRLNNLTIGTLRAAHRGALFHACCTTHVKRTSRNFLPDEAKFVLRTDQKALKLYHPVSAQPAAGDLRFLC